MKKTREFFSLLIGFVIGSSFMMFFGTSKGKDLRKEVLKEWEKGNNPSHAKIKIIAREFLLACKEVGPAIDEVVNSKPMKSTIKDGKETVQKVKKKVKAQTKKAATKAKKTVKKAKKQVATKLRQVSGLKKG